MQAQNGFAHTIPPGRPTKGPKSWWSPVITQPQLGHPLTAAAQGRGGYTGIDLCLAPQAAGTFSSFPPGYHRLLSTGHHPTCSHTATAQRAGICSSGASQHKTQTLLLYLFYYSPQERALAVSGDCGLSVDCVCGRALGSPDF